MSIAERLYLIAWNLGTLAVACAPIFVLVYYIEIFGEKVVTKLGNSILEWSDKQFARLERLEKRSKTDE